MTMGPNRRTPELGDPPADSDAPATADDSALGLEDSGLPSASRIRNLVQVARMYYEQDLSQQEIAAAMERSRPTVSRMLTAARELGIVQIDIRDPLERSVALERALQERFGLDVVRVLLTPRDERDLTHRLGRVGAAHLQSVLRAGLTVGVSNGRTMASIASFLEPVELVDVTVIQIIGASGTDDPAIDTPDIARSLAAAYKTTARYLHVPLLVESPELRVTLVRDHNTARTLQAAANADIALVGVGMLDPSNMSPIFKGFLSAADLTRAGKSGAVGHMCGEFFDSEGARLDVELNERVIGIGLRGLKRVPNVIGVAGGASKAVAILGALRGGYLNTLITDDRAAHRLLELESS
jgi:deoxyribonucleoside regulator